MREGAALWVRYYIIVRTHRPLRSPVKLFVSGRFVSLRVVAPAMVKRSGRRNPWLAVSILN